MLREWTRMEARVQQPCSIQRLHKSNKLNITLVLGPQTGIIDRPYYSIQRGCWMRLGLHFALEHLAAFSAYLACSTWNLGLLSSKYFMFSTSDPASFAKPVFQINEYSVIILSQHFLILISNSIHFLSFGLYHFRSLCWEAMELIFLLPIQKTEWTLRTELR